jgi:hypothetical protein
MECALFKIVRTVHKQIKRIKWNDLKIGLNDRRLEIKWDIFKPCGNGRDKRLQGYK